MTRDNLSRGAALSANADAVGAAMFQPAEAYASYDANPHLLERNGILLRLLPADVRRVIDVGCGPGVAGWALAEHGRTVFSLDASLSAMVHRPPKPTLGNIGSLPYRDAAADLVMSLEVLEHLPPETLASAVAELTRVAERWLLIGVPNHENLARADIVCPACGLQFNRSGHLNVFDIERIGQLFTGWDVVDYVVCGPRVRRYHPRLLWLRHHWARRFSEIPEGSRPICPRCNHSDFAPIRHNGLSFLLDAVNRVVSRRAPYWLITLLERSETG